MLLLRVLHGESVPAHISQETNLIQTTVLAKSVDSETGWIRIPASLSQLLAFMAQTFYFLRFIYFIYMSTL